MANNNNVVTIKNLTVKFAGFLHTRELTYSAVQAKVTRAQATEYQLVHTMSALIQNSDLGVLKAANPDLWLYKRAKDNNDGTSTLYLESLYQPDLIGIKVGGTDRKGVAIKKKTEIFGGTVAHVQVEVKGANAYLKAVAVLDLVGKREAAEPDYSGFGIEG